MIKSRRTKLIKWLSGVSVILLMLGISAVTVFAAGDVSSAIESTWTSAQTQIKNVVNNVVFPAPFLPSSPYIRPSSNTKSISFNTLFFSKLFATCSIQNSIFFSFYFDYETILA